MAGWYTERHPKLDPVATMTDGIFVAGVCQGPKGYPGIGGSGGGGSSPRDGYDHQR
jgi:heterodisulfide reductase subunit A